VKFKKQLNDFNYFQLVNLNILRDYKDQILNILKYVYHWDETSKMNLIVLMKINWALICDMKEEIMYNSNKAIIKETKFLRKCLFR